MEPASPTQAAPMPPPPAATSGSVARDARDFAELSRGAILQNLGGQGEDGRAGPEAGDGACEVLVATGADRIRFLNGVVTGAVASTPVGGGCHASLLNLKAHVVSEMRIFPRARDTYLVVPAGQGATTAAALNRYAIMDDFTAAPAVDMELLAVWGPASEGHLSSVGYAVPEGSTATRAWTHDDRDGDFGRLWIVGANQLGAHGYWLGGPRANIAALRSALLARGVRLLPRSVAAAARVAAFEPVWGREITDAHFPMEVGLEDTIDYTKGCFLGQEPIVRIRDRGHVNWRLAQLRLAPPPADPHAGSEPTSAAWPALASQLVTESKSNAGKLTTVAEVPGQGLLALALLHASVAVGAEVRLVGPEGTTTTATVTRDR